MHRISIHWKNIFISLNNMFASGYWDQYGSSFWGTPVFGVYLPVWIFRWAIYPYSCEEEWYLPSVNIHMVSFISQEKNLSQWIVIWYFRITFWEKAFPHLVHGSGFFPVCMAICIKISFLRKRLITFATMKLCIPKDSFKWSHNEAYFFLQMICHSGYTFSFFSPICAFIYLIKWMLS